MLSVIVTDISCSHSGDKYFEESYFDKVHIVEKYGKQCCQGILTVDTSMANLIEFTDACDYLGNLTGCSFHITYVDIPVYDSKIKLMCDIVYLKKWFFFNGGKLDKDQADSIVSNK